MRARTDCWNTVKPAPSRVVKSDRPWSSAPRLLPDILPGWRCVCFFPVWVSAQWRVWVWCLRTHLISADPLRRSLWVCVCLRGLSTPERLWAAWILGCLTHTIIIITIIRPAAAAQRTPDLLFLLLLLLLLPPPSPPSATPLAGQDFRSNGFSE